MDAVRTYERGGGSDMKKGKRVLVQFLIVGSIIAMYVLPALAGGGGGL